MSTPIFTEKERHELSLHKYTRGFEDITKEQLVGLRQECVLSWKFA